MITPIANIFTNQKFVEIAQNTKAAVSIETALKATGRPGFILMDNELDEDTQRYAAAKEFLYQVLCLGIYLTMVIPIFKKGTFKLFKNHIFKGESDFSKFRNANEYIDYRELADLDKGSRLEKMQKEKHIKNLSSDLIDDLKNQENPEKHFLVKGSIEFSSIVGSALGLAVLAPIISHAILHPIMDFFGITKKEDKLDKEA